MWYRSIYTYMADKLQSLFTDLKTNKSLYLNADTGKDFEERISTKLSKMGFGRIRKIDVDNNKFAQLKVEVLTKNSSHDLQNPFADTFREHYIEQPYGKQNYPDIIVLDQSKLISIEVKFSAAKQGKPVWNSGLPRPNGIYIFGSLERDDITFFRGCDVLSIAEIEGLQDFFDVGLKGHQDHFNKEEMGKQKYGFSVYVRKTYEQKSMFNKGAVLNFFTNPDRELLEKSVLAHLDY